MWVDAFAPVSALEGTPNELVPLHLVDWSLPITAGSQNLIFVGENATDVEG